MEFGFFDTLKLIGALGFFIYGMKVMSEGIQKAAGSNLRAILASMTKNRYFGVLTGFIITCLVQSSSATTVMTVSFVNAGLLSLVESAGVMMGANVGTTLTAWLVSIFGFKVKIAAIALPIIAVAMPMLFAKKSNIKYWGEFMIGFALLFMGLDELKHSVPDLKDNPHVLQFLADYSDLGVLSTLLFVGVGTLLTIIVQSSSAAMALTITMCHQGWIPFEIAAPMILGENIGTTITAELASLVGNVHAKRSARIHSMFNIIGVTWMVFAHPLYLNAIDSIMVSQGIGSPMTDPHAIPIGLSYFHTAFNVSNVLLLIWFVPLLVKIAIRTVPSKGDDDEQYNLDYIGSGFMNTPELSIVEAQKEVAKFGHLTKKMLGKVQKLMTETSSKDSSKLLAKIKKYEDMTDRLEVDVAEYISTVTQQELSERSVIKARSILSIVNDLERVGDILYQMSKSLEAKMEEKSWFTPEQRDNIHGILKLVDDAFDIMIENLEANYANVTLEKAKNKEIQINKYRNALKADHLSSIEKGDYNVKSGMIYVDLYSSAEKLGDHIINVTEAVTGKI